MLTFNSDKNAYGYISFHFNWSPTGAIKCTMLLKGLPAVPFGVRACVDLLVLRSFGS